MSLRFFDLGDKGGRIGFKFRHAMLAAKADFDAVMRDDMRLAHAAEFFTGHDADIERIGAFGTGGVSCWTGLAAGDQQGGKEDGSECMRQCFHELNEQT